MSIEALKLIPQDDAFDETTFDQEFTSKNKLQDHLAVMPTLKTILKLINPTRVHGAGNHEITTLFRDTVFKNRNTIGSSSLDELAAAGLSDTTGTLTEQGVKLIKDLAAAYKGVEGELAY
jgi:hypothetical protein